MVAEVNWNPLGQVLRSYKHFFNWQGICQGILGLQGFITACDWKGTRQAQIPCCTNPRFNHHTLAGI